jgi:hypothetical protein
MLSFSPDEKLNNSEKQFYDAYKKAEKIPGFADEMLKALKADRKAMLQSDALRSALFIAMAALLIYLFIEKKIKFELTAALLAALVLVDLWQVDKRYLNNSKFIAASEYQKNFLPRAVDLQIMKDTDLHYRVHDVSIDPFNTAIVSNNLKTIGGYHAAKLQRYQDIIERHLRAGNMNVLNILNAKYFIVKGSDGKLQAQLNPNARGNAWAVKNIQWAKDADEELNALENFAPENTVVIDERFKPELNSQPAAYDGNAKVKLASYHPDKMVYSFESASAQFIVFSEIFYNGNKDWLSYIDGKKNKHIRVNYLLRGMPVPAGNHQIIFEFKPQSFYTGEKITLAANLIFILLAAGYAVQLFRRKL